MCTFNPLLVLLYCLLLILPYYCTCNPDVPEWVTIQLCLLIFSYLSFNLLLLLLYCLLDVPEWVTIQLKRQDYIVGKVLDNIEDDDFVDTNRTTFSVPNYLIDSTDIDPM
jgi:hypothetical protein